MVIVVGAKTNEVNKLDVVVASCVVDEEGDVCVANDDED